MNSIKLKHFCLVFDFGDLFLRFKTDICIYIYIYICISLSFSRSVNWLLAVSRATSKQRTEIFVKRKRKRNYTDANFASELFRLCSLWGCGSQCAHVTNLYCISEFFGFYIFVCDIILYSHNFSIYPVRYMCVVLRGIADVLT